LQDYDWRLGVGEYAPLFNSILACAATQPLLTYNESDTLDDANSTNLY